MQVRACVSIVTKTRAKTINFEEKNIENSRIQKMGTTPKFAGFNKLTNITECNNGSKNSAIIKQTKEI